MYPSTSDAPGSRAIPDCSTIPDHARTLSPQKCTWSKLLYMNENHCLLSVCRFRVSLWSMRLFPGVYIKTASHMVCAASVLEKDNIRCMTVGSVPTVISVLCVLPRNNAASS